MPSLRGRRSFDGQEHVVRRLPLNCTVHRYRTTFRRLLDGTPRRLHQVVGEDRHIVIYYVKPDRSEVYS